MKKTDTVSFWLVFAGAIIMMLVANAYRGKVNHWRDVAFNGYSDTLLIKDDVIVIRHHVCTTWVERVVR